MSEKRTFLEKRMKNRRFFKNEGLILNVFVSERKNEMTIKKIAKKTGLSRSTVYMHHHTVKEIMPDYERYVLATFSKMVRKKLNRKNRQLKSLYLEMLLFILRNKKIFGMFVKFSERRVFVKMLGKFENKIVSSAKLPKSAKKILRIYESEVVEIIFEWGQESFLEDKLENVLSDIMYLTETCRERLMPINRE